MRFVGGADAVVLNNESTDTNDLKEKQIQRRDCIDNIILFYSFFVSFFIINSLNKSNIFKYKK